MSLRGSGTRDVGSVNPRRAQACHESNKTLPPNRDRSGRGWLVVRGQLAAVATYALRWTPPSSSTRRRSGAVWERTNLEQGRRLHLMLLGGSRESGQRE